MSISAITLLSGYELFQALRKVGDSQSRELAVTAGIVQGMDRIREDLLHALPRARPGGLVFEGDSPMFEGERGATRLLDFCSLCTGRGSDFLSTLRRPHRVRYELRRTRDGMGLYRIAAPVVGAGGGAVHQGAELMLDGVQQLEILFNNGQTLERSFSSDDRLPVGVDLTVMACDLAWPLCVRLPCGTPEERP